MLAEKAGPRVLVGACVELGGEGLPFAPLVDAMRELARTLSSEELARMLGSARPELAQLLPELDEAAALEAPREISRVRLFEQVLGLVTRLAADQPLVLVIEDLHWADRSTLDLVTFLVRAAVPSPVLTLITYRTDELHRRHPLRPVLVELERLRHVQVIELQRFDRAGVTAQLRGILGEEPEPAFVSDVFARSGGNAFLTEEAVALVSGSSVISSSLRGLLLDRVERLSEPTQRLLRVVAAAGGGVGHALLQAVAGLPEADLHTALREAVEHHVLIVDDNGRGYAFRHLLVREAVAGDNLPGELVSIHTAFARAIDADPSLAGTATAAAITGTDHPGLLELAVEAARYSDEIDRARALVHQALREVDRETDPVRAALLLWRLGLIVEASRPREAHEAIAEAASLVPASADACSRLCWPNWPGSRCGAATSTRRATSARKPWPRPEPRARSTRRRRL